MTHRITNKHIAVAVAAAIGSSIVAAPTIATAAEAAQGKYLAGDIHNHTTCSDGSISMQKLVKKSTDVVDTPWGLDWFVQAGHGGTGNRNCTLVEDESLGTPAYPYVAGQSPQTTWTASGVTLKGDPASGNMWRWQAIKEYQYPLIEYLAAYKNLPLFLGVESVVAGHEHTSMGVIKGQMPGAITTLPTTPGYTATGNADALAQWQYCFDRGNSDLSRGAENQWNCAVTGSANEADPSWSAVGQKLNPAGGAGTGIRGHLKTVEGIKWMKEHDPKGSYYVPAHLERAGPFNPDGNNGFNIEHLRNLNNAGPDIAFGMETQPGHGASSDRGEYSPLRNTIAGVRVDSVGGTTYGGTGIYGAQIGGVWDALLGEGRGFWFLASSDWHNRGSFGPDDRRTTQDFYPGEYQRNYTLVKTSVAKVTPQAVVNGLRSGNNFASSGQLIDRLAFVACAVSPSFPRGEVESLAMQSALGNLAPKAPNCATMGEKLKVKAGTQVAVAIIVRDPEGKNYSPYTFANPSLLQVGKTQPLDAPVLDHIDLIRGFVTGYKTPGEADYSGEWPRNTNWLRADGTTAGLDAVPAGAKNTSAAVVRTFSAEDGWRPIFANVDETIYLKMSYVIKADQSQYVRLRGTNMPAAVPYETDGNGNPLADVYTNASNPARLRIPCEIPHSAGNQFDGCPDHMEVATDAANPIVGKRAVSYDVAAWADLWFYSNPIYVEVKGSVPVAGVK